MNSVAVVLAPHVTKWFLSLANALVCCFQEIGLPANVVLTKKINETSRLPHNIIFVIAPDVFEDKAHQLIHKTEGNLQRVLGKTYVCWDLEQTPFVHQSSPIADARFSMIRSYHHKYDVYLTGQKSQVDFFAKNDLTAYALNAGYHESYTQRVTEQEEIYDVFFVGAMLPRRAKLLQVLVEAGVSIFPIKGELFDPTQKAIAMKSSRICLNMHHTDQNYFEKTRIIGDYLSNQCFCLTETIEDKEGFVSGVHFMESPYEDLVNQILFWIKCPEDRRTIASSGFEYVKKNYKLLDFIKEIYEGPICRTVNK